MATRSRNQHWQYFDSLKQSLPLNPDQNIVSPFWVWKRSTSMLQTIGWRLALPLFGGRPNDSLIGSKAPLAWPEAWGELQSIFVCALLYIPSQLPQTTDMLIPCSCHAWLHVICQWHWIIGALVIIGASEDSYLSKGHCCVNATFSVNCSCIVCLFVMLEGLSCIDTVVLTKSDCSDTMVLGWRKKWKWRVITNVNSSWPSYATSWVWALVQEMLKPLNNHKLLTVWEQNEFIQLINSEKCKTTKGWAVSMLCCSCNHILTPRIRDSSSCCCWVTKKQG